MLRNRLRELINNGRPSLGMHTFSRWPYITELVGYSGKFDYIEFVGEYAPYNIEELEGICMAAELHGMGTMMKVDFENRGYIAQRAIGAGFKAILFADVHNAAEAKECVKLVKPSTPEDGGKYGCSMRRGTGMTYGGTPEYIQLLREIVVAIMIENKEAVENIEEICAVPGVDMIQWGPADHAMSRGWEQNRFSERSRATEEKVFKTAFAAGIIPRAEVNSIEEVKWYTDLGVKHFCYGSEVMNFYNYCVNEGDAMRKILAECFHEK